MSLLKSLRGSSLLACGAWILVNLGSPLVAAASEAASELPNVHTYEVRLSEKGHEIVRRDGRMSLPQLRAYDVTGQQVLDTGTGFSPDKFASQIKRLLLDPRPTDSATQLGDELALVEAPDGGPAPTQPASGMTIVKYEADWCLPCKAQSKVLTETLARYPGQEVHVMHVDCNPPEGSGEKAPIKINAKALPPELLEKLRSGKVTPEEMEEIKRLSKSAEDGKS